MSTNRIIGIRDGGKARVGNGVFTSKAEEGLGELRGEEAVRVLDQGATYRLGTLRALGKGAASADDVRRLAIEDVNSLDPNAFLEQFIEYWTARRHELYTPHINQNVATIGELDQAQHYYTDILNLRIGHAASAGIEVVIIDSRTPHILTAPSVKSGILVPAVDVYIDTPIIVAARREADRTMKPNAQCLAEIIERNEKDENRDVFPNEAPTDDECIDLNPVNHREVLASIKKSGVPSGKILRIDNGEATTIADMSSWARQIAVHSFMHASRLL